MSLPFFSRLLPQNHRLTLSPPPPGLYIYTYQAEGEKSRIHLRIEPEANGTLIINANRVFHLNPTAATMAYLALEGIPPDEAVRFLTSLFRVPRRSAQSDYTQFTRQLDELVRPDGACPIHDLDLEVLPPFSAAPSAPYRMDLALSYRCNNRCAHCYNDLTRNLPELDTQAWIAVLERIRQIGIPHVVFTGGEPTLRDDLPQLVAHAQASGMICGLNTNGRRLQDQHFLDKLLTAGLDHVQITVESHDPQIHDSMVALKGAWRQTIAGLQNCLGSNLYVMTNTTMLRQNSPYLQETLQFLADLGVPTIGLNALIYSGKGKQVGTGLNDAELTPLLEMAREHTGRTGQRLIWYTPTQYCHFDPMELELGIKGCTAALYNMCVEPDGGVIPCQSYYQQVGNLLQDEWPAIWNHDLCLQLRNRRYVESKCHGCSLLDECGGGCPLAIPVQRAEPVLTLNQ
ncbi:MAG: radical SAM protein [Anaerolineales bacterium]|nr:radical SAM protein [Anaerolineales bacterium]